MRLEATTVLALSQDAVVLARHAERLLSGTGRDGRSRPGADVQPKHQMTDKVSQSVSGTRPNEQVSAGDHQVVEVMQQGVRLEFGGRDFGVAEVDQD
jgi:hypothetical protein